MVMIVLDANVALDQRMNVFSFNNSSPTTHSSRVLAISSLASGNWEIKD